VKVLPRQAGDPICDQPVKGNVTATWAKAFKLINTINAGIINGGNILLSINTVIELLTSVANYYVKF
jgi:hypothetical protein